MSKKLKHSNRKSRKIRGGDDCWRFVRTSKDGITHDETRMYYKVLGMIQNVQRYHDGSIEYPYCDQYSDTLHPNRATIKRAYRNIFHVYPYTASYIINYLEKLQTKNKQNLLDYISKYIYVNSMERNPAFIHRVVTEFKNKEIHDRAVKIGLFRYYKLI